jgi:hypothetical protein
MIHQASDVVEDVVDEANTSSILSASKLCRSSSFLAMPPPQGMTMRASGASPAPGANLPSGIKRRSESFLMLPNDGNDGDSEDDDSGAASAAQARRLPPEDCSGSGNSNSNSNESAQRPTVIVSPDTNAVAANGESGAIPDLNLNEQATAESQGGDVDDDDDEDEYFLQDLSPEACESIVDGIFGGGGSLNVVVGGGDAGTHSSKTSIGDDEDGDEFASLSMMMLPPLKKMRTEHRTGPAGSSIRATVPAHDEPLAV